MQETFASYDEMGRRSGGEQRLKILRTQIARRVPPISLQVDAPIIREDDTFLLQHLAHRARTAKRMAPSQLAFAIDDALRRNSFHCFTHDPAYHTRTTWIAKRPGNPAIGGDPSARAGAHKSKRPADKQVRIVLCNHNSPISSHKYVSMPFSLTNAHTILGYWHQQVNTH